MKSKRALLAACSQFERQETTLSLQHNSSSRLTHSVVARVRQHHITKRRQSGAGSKRDTAREEEYERLATIQAIALVEAVERGAARARQ